MTDSYFTLKGRGESEIIINKSRFLTFALRTETEEEASLFLNSIKKKYWDATHNCSAYLIGGKQKCDDDGEPSGTAGKPILEIIKKNSLQDVTVVVTRYFGGVKLGAGGLIRAYAKAAAAGIGAAGITLRELYLKISLKIDYTMLGSLENYLHNYPILEKNFADIVLIRLLVKKPDLPTFERHITEKTFAQAIITREGETYF